MLQAVNPNDRGVGVDFIPDLLCSYLAFFYSFMVVCLKKCIFKQAVRDELIVELVNQCRSNQKKLMNLIGSTG